MPGRCARRVSFAYLASTIVLTTASVAALKLITHVDCPWDLARYGGAYSYFPLLGPHLSSHEGQCFPGSHASAGFALLSLYFLHRDRSRWRAGVGLAAGIAAGVLFAVGQETRGAHRGGFASSGRFPLGLSGSG